MRIAFYVLSVLSAFSAGTSFSLCFWITQNISKIHYIPGRAEAGFFASEIRWLSQQIGPFQLGVFVFLTWALIASLANALTGNKRQIELSLLSIALSVLFLTLSIGLCVQYLVAYGVPILSPTL